MAVDDDVLLKNPFGFELAIVIVNDSVTREAITREQMRKFLNFIQDDAIYAKYYDAVYILFHTGLRISEFCGVTVKDIDLERKTLNVERQLIRTSEMDYRCETTKTAAGKRVIPLTDDVVDKFQNILDDRCPPRRELVIDGYYGFLYYDKNGLPCVAMHWQHRFNRMVNQHNDLYRVPLPNVTPHVCRHTYCSNMAKSGMSPKTLQYLMGHSDISVTMNTYMHVRFDDAEEELRRPEAFGKAQPGSESKTTRRRSKPFKTENQEPQQDDLHAAVFLVYRWFSLISYPLWLRVVGAPARCGDSYKKLINCYHLVMNRAKKML